LDEGADAEEKTKDGMHMEEVTKDESWKENPPHAKEVVELKIQDMAKRFSTGLWTFSLKRRQITSRLRSTRMS
jgi:hypothetical protein